MLENKTNPNFSKMKKNSTFENQSCFNKQYHKGKENITAYAHIRTSLYHTAKWQSVYATWVFVIQESLEWFTLFEVETYYILFKKSAQWQLTAFWPINDFKGLLPSVTQNKYLLTIIMSFQVSFCLTIPKYGIKNC